MEHCRFRQTHLLFLSRVAPDKLSVFMSQLSFYVLWKIKWTIGCYMKFIAHIWPISLEPLEPPWASLNPLKLLDAVSKNWKARSVGEAFVWDNDVSFKSLLCQRRFHPIPNKRRNKWKKPQNSHCMLAKSNT